MNQGRPNAKFGTENSAEDPKSAKAPILHTTKVEVKEKLEAKADDLFMGNSLYDETFDEENVGARETHNNTIQIPLILHRHWISHGIPGIVADMVSMGH